MAVSKGQGPVAATGREGEPQHREASSAPLDVAAQHWNRQVGQRPQRTRWWQSRKIRAYINRLLDPDAGDEPSDGALRWAKRAVSERGLSPYRRAISVGGGGGVKEAGLIRMGLADTVDIFELSEARIEQGKRRAEHLDMADRLRFHLADAFAADRKGQYDIVHWNNALHHMLDVQQAILWSRHVLQPQGLFYMDDFVGPNRFQWSDTTLALASAARASLPQAYLSKPGSGSKQSFPTKLRRIDPAGLAAADPTEAADSARILPTLRRVFPSASIKRTGGVVYLLALNDVLQNLDEETEPGASLLEVLLRFDTEATLHLGAESLYAGALAFADDAPPRRRALAWAEVEHRGRAGQDRIQHGLRSLAQAPGMGPVAHTVKRSLRRLLG